MDVKTLESRHVLQTYKRAPVVFTRGEGVYLFDEDGRRYLDLISGVGVASLGHANPALAAALADQARTLVHTSNLYYHGLQGQVASRLASLSGLPRAFFCNSGTEAMEGCLKFARRYWHTAGDATRTGLVALEHSFHGRTMGSLSVTWDEHYRAPFEPLLQDVVWIPADNPAALAEAVSDRTTAIVIEAIQGEGGVQAAQPGVRRRRPRRAAADRRPAHRRRGAVRPRAHGPRVRVSAPRPRARPGRRRQGARRRHAGRRGVARANGSPPPSPPAIMDRPTAATCSRAGRRWCFSMR